MRKLAAAAVIILGLAAVMGAGRGGTYQGGSYARTGATYAAGGKAKVDTFRVMSEHTTFKNPAALAAGYIYTNRSRYTTINSTTGLTNIPQAVRFTNLTRGTPTTVNSYPAGEGYQLIGKGGGDITGDVITWDSSQYLALLWVSANGLSTGQRIEEAYLNINADAFGFTIPSGQTLAARLDTISTDYRITAASSYGVNGSNTYMQFNATWNTPNAAIGAAWSPTLDSRNDWHDFGPRSNNVITAGTYAKGTCLRLNVTDAVQQAADNGTLGRGLLFVLCINGGTTQLGISAGFNPTFVGTGWGNGWPVFTAVSTSRRGDIPWSGVRVPVSIQFDDGYKAQVGYFKALRDSNLMFSAASCSANVYLHTQVDSLYRNNPSLFYFIDHARVHNTSLGAMTAGQLAFNLNRTWYPQLLTGYAAADTANIVDFALTGSGGVDGTVTVVEGLINNGYRSMRSGGFDWVTSTMGPGCEHDTRLAWNGYVNKYQIWSVNSRYIFANPAVTDTATNAQIEEALTDYVDSYYTDYGKAALVIYAHYFKESLPYDYLTPTNLRYFIGLTRRLNSCELLNYKDVIDARLAGATAKTPAQVNAAGGGSTLDAAKIARAAAHQDSCVQAGGHNNLLQAWIGPK